MAVWPPVYYNGSTDPFFLSDPEGSNEECRLISLGAFSVIPFSISTARPLSMPISQPLHNQARVCPSGEDVLQSTGIILLPSMLQLATVIAITKLRGFTPIGIMEGWNNGLRGIKRSNMIFPLLGPTIPSFRLSII